jgi:hypothetical protein
VPVEVAGLRANEDETHLTQNNTNGYYQAVFGTRQKNLQKGAKPLATRLGKVLNLSDG